MVKHNLILLSILMINISVYYMISYPSHKSFSTEPLKRQEIDVLMNEPCDSLYKLRTDLYLFHRNGSISIEPLRIKKVGI